jgi:general secretion pathway protein K
MTLARSTPRGFVPLVPLARSGDSRSLARRGAARRGRDAREQGIALIIAITAITILAALLADLHETTGSAYATSASQRDSLRAEYMAKSGLNLTRLLVANEPAIRQVVLPIYQAMVGRPPPQLPIWTYADMLLRPFCRNDREGQAARQQAEDDGEPPEVPFDFSSTQGLDDTPGRCEIVALAENAKINVNQPLNLTGDDARRSVAMQVFAMVGGYQQPSPFDPLFGREDADGQFSSRQDIVSSMIDWWDQDTDQTTFDPGAGTVANQGSEDNPYRRMDDPYEPKNAPFDSLEELRLIRGVGDDFWATFIEPTQDDPQARAVTIYGSGAVNPNEAPPEVLLARLCSILSAQTLCTDPGEAAKFIQLVNTARSIIQVPFFTRSGDFLNFLEGRGGSRDLYPMLRGFLGADSPLLFLPVTIPQESRAELDRSFVTAARILTIRVTGSSGRSRVRLNTVMNFHDRWTPPPPNGGAMPGLGIFHYYRVD